MLGSASLRTMPGSTNRRSTPPRVSGFARYGEPVRVSGSDAEIASRVLERLQLEVIVLDPTGAIVFCNGAARRLLAANAGVFSHRGSLHFANCENNRWLQSELRSEPQAREPKHMVLILQEDPGKQRIVSLDVIRDEAAATPSYILTFWRLANSLAEDGVRQLMRYFGLTPAEQRLTLFLNRGGRLMEAAKTFGLSRHTVSNQLRSIFDKVGVRRQTELTRLMCVGPYATIRCEEGAGLSA